MANYPTRGDLLWQTTEDDESTDCQINVQGEAFAKEFKLHKMILTKYSDVFKAMFNTEMQEKITGIVNIKEVDPRIMEIVFRFMYAGNLTDLTRDDIREILIVADRYNILCLPQHCALFCMQHLCCCDNVLYLLNIINMFTGSQSYPRLKMRLERLFKDNPYTCISGENKLDIEAGTLIHLLNIAQSQFHSELHVIEFVNDWVLNKIKTDNPNYDEKDERMLIRRELKPKIFKMIFFLTLNLQDFFLFTTSKNWLIPKEKEIIINAIKKRYPCARYLKRFSPNEIARRIWLHQTAVKSYAPLHRRHN